VEVGHTLNPDACTLILTCPGARPVTDAVAAFVLLLVGVTGIRVTRSDGLAVNENVTSDKNSKAPPPPFSPIAIATKVAGAPFTEIVGLLENALTEKRQVLGCGGFPTAETVTAPVADRVPAAAVTVEVPAETLVTIAYAPAPPVGGIPTTIATSGLEDVHVRGVKTFCCCPLESVSEGFICIWYPGPISSAPSPSRVVTVGSGVIGFV
jgi:hypothetical protein